MTGSLTSVDTTKTWLVYTYTSEDGTGADIGQKLVRGLVTSSTQVTFDRDNTGQQIFLTWYAIEFTDGTAVQSGTQAFTSADTVQNATISAVTTTRAIGVGGSHMRGGISPYNGDDNPGVAWFTVDLTTATNLQMTRATTASAAADLGWFVVDFAPAPTVTPTPTPTVTPTSTVTVTATPTVTGDADCDRHRDADCHADANGDGNPDGDRDDDPDADRNGHADADQHGDGDDHADAD